jgi:hypothetical protein
VATLSTGDGAQEWRYETLTGLFGVAELAVFVLDKHQKPPMPCTEKRARPLLERRRAVVHKIDPFTIRLKDRVGGVVWPVRVKLGPTRKTAGIAVSREEGGTEPATALGLFQRTHRGDATLDKLTTRRGYRRRRRHANLRYLGFDHRGHTRKPVPSLQRRVCAAGVDRLRRPVPPCGVAIARVRFDSHAMQRPKISGVEFQQGATAGYAIRRYALKKFRVGRLVVGANGSFNVQTGTGVVQGINHKHFKILQRADGYGCAVSASLQTAFLPDLRAGISSGES